MLEDSGLDYKKLKFKCGLEVHQQLGSGRKLFCYCPPVLRSDEPDAIIHRRLHSVAGETGSVDLAAKYQSSLKKDFIYQGYSDTNCLLEYDETPPYPLDQEAL